MDKEFVSKIVGNSGSYKKLDTTPPPGSSNRLVGGMEAVVEVNAQELRLVRPYYESYLNVPGDLTSEAQIVMHGLFSCFDKQGSVQEGKVKDLIWGFDVSGIEPACSYKGLSDLYNAGYITFTDANNVLLTPHTSNLPECFVRYGKKLLDLVYV